MSVAQLVTVTLSTYQPSSPPQPSRPKSKRKPHTVAGLDPERREVDERRAPRADDLAAVGAGEPGLAVQRVGGLRAPRPAR